MIKQRNALLRTAYLTRKVGGTRGQDLSTLAVWDQHLAHHGAELLAGRLELAAALGPRDKAYDAVAAAGRRPRSSTRRRSATAAPRPASSRPCSPPCRSDVRRGGARRDPGRPAPRRLTLALGDLPVKGYASHGESWSFALALRLAAYDLLRSDGIEPVLVLDDVFAELDGGRRDRLAALVADAGQLLVTCAVPEDVPASLTAPAST